jgi:hypothetical protein
LNSRFRFDVILSEAKDLMLHKVIPPSTPTTDVILSEAKDLLFLSPCR